MSLKKPQKAPTDPITNEQLKVLRYPIVGSPKLDGFRCVVDEVPKSSQMKIWPNLFVCDELSKPEYQGLDGELIVGEPNDPNVFNNSQVLRQIGSKPDFTFYVMDNWIDGGYSYKERWIDRKLQDFGRVVVLEQRLLNTPEEVLGYEAWLLEMGFEGAMIRSLDARYKDNRCTFREMNIFKRKPFVECEAVIVNVIEGRQNLNESKMTETGNMRRSSHAANKIPNGTLGSFELKSKLWPVTFNAGCGEGYTQRMKQELWNRRNELIGQITTVKYQKYGSKDRPRLPSVIKIRPSWDVEGL